MKTQLAQADLDFADIIGFTSLASSYFKLYSDFVCANLEFTVITNGTVNTTLTGTTADPGNHPGIVALNTGTTSSGYARFGVSNVLSFNLSNALWKFETCVQLSALSTTAQAFELTLGFGIENSPSSGVYFKYYQPDSINWTCCARNSGGTISAVNSGVVLNASQWYRLTLFLDGINNAYFYINGSLVGTVNTNIPWSSNLVGLDISIFKATGTTSRILNVDYVELLAKFITSR